MREIIEFRDFSRLFVSASLSLASAMRFQILPIFAKKFFIGFSIISCKHTAITRHTVMEMKILKKLFSRTYLKIYFVILHVKNCAKKKRMQYHLIS